MPRRAVAIMNSGWSSKYPNKTLVFGSPEPTNTSTLHFPSWHEDAVTWLINKRQINAVGVDTPSTDYGMSSTFPCHTLMGKNRVVGIESVANLDNVPESGSTIYIPVLNIADGSGGPARVFATYDDEPNKTNAAAMVTCFMFFLYLLAAVLVCNVLQLYNFVVKTEYKVCFIINVVNAYEYLQSTLNEVCYTLKYFLVSTEIHSIIKDSMMDASKKQKYV